MTVSKVYFYFQIQHEQYQKTGQVAETQEMKRRRKNIALRETKMAKRKTKMLNVSTVDLYNSDHSFNCYKMVL